MCVGVSKLNSRLQESEMEAMEKVSGLEKKLIQTTKEVELLKVELFLLCFQLHFRSLSVSVTCGTFHPKPHPQWKNFQVKQPIRTAKITPESVKEYNLIFFI